VIAMLVTVVLAVGVFTPIAALGWWLVRLGTVGGDLPGDATSRTGGDGTGIWLSVENRSATPVLVGARVRDQRPLATLFQPPALVVRPARFGERRSAGSWSDGVLGAVPPGQMRWVLPGVTRPSRLLVALGQPGDRLRIHDHLLGPDVAAPVSDTDPRAEPPSPLRR